MPRRWLSPDFFTDEKMKKATVPERLLAAAIIANQDDDGRLRGDPAYLRAIAFLYDDYSLEEIKAMRDHLAQANPNILIYQNSSEEYIQLTRYKRYQKPRYYHPSKFPVPPGWPFEEENHPVTTQQPSSPLVVSMGKGKDLDQNKGKDKDLGGGGKTPSLTGSILFQTLTDTQYKSWGKMPNSRETAFLRDIGQEISRAGGATATQVSDAYREAAVQNKLSVSYVRSILYAWLGIERGRSP